MNAFSVATHTAGQKVYFEVTITQQTFTSIIGMGSDNTSTSRTDSASITPTLGFVVTSNTGNFLCLDSADSNTATLPTWTTGDTIDVAFNATTNRAWFRKNNGTWNESAGGGDPAAGTGGKVVAAGAGPFYAFGGADAVDGDAITARFASGSWTHTAPSGFTQIAA